MLVGGANGYRGGDGMRHERTSSVNVSSNGESDVHSTYSGGQRTKRSQRNDCREHELQGECALLNPGGLCLLREIFYRPADGVHITV